MMLDGITWETYLTAIAVLAAAYYAVVGVLYYRNEITGLLKGKYKDKNGAAEDERDSPEANDAKGGFDGLEKMVASIRVILEQAGKEASKEKLLEQLNATLASYDGLRQPAFRNAIRNFIIIHAESICGVNFSEEELEVAWKSLLHNMG